MQDLMPPIGTPDGLFHDGNPATGELGTIVSALWLNAVQGAARSVQSELLSVLTAAGIATDPAKADQVLQAIRKLAGDKVSGHEQAADPHPQYMTGDEVATAIAGKANKATTLAGYGITDGLRRLTTGQPLPTADVGPIWHDDYGSIMVWQVFNANGANYAGYASVLIGSLLMDTQITSRAGYIMSGAQNLSRTAYAALRAWAMHNGIMVAANVWTAGAIAVADNADGSTFRVFDLRGEFPRFWDDGRGVDSGRAFGSAQESTLLGASAAVGTFAAGNNIRGLSNGEPYGAAAQTFSSLYATGSESFATYRIHPRNTALRASVKF